jgi:hypothetical protein
MDNQELKDLLLIENSRANTDFVGNLVRQKPEMIAELWEIYFRKEEPISRRAAWIIDTVSENEPGWVEPYIPRLIELLPTFNHDGLKRHGLRMISRNRIPEGNMADLMNTCFEWLLSTSEAVAAKLYCILILYSISQDLPEIRRELIDTIEFQMQDGTSGFKNIGRKMLTKLYKDTQHV